MRSVDPAAAELERSSERWLAWLAGELARRNYPPGSALLALWDVLEELARSSGAHDPTALAAQLLTLIEGAMAGALIDRHPAAARHARELTRIALEASAPE